MEKRMEGRRLHAIELMYGCNDTYCPGTALNLSCHGMRIHAESQIVPIDREVKLVLTLADEVVSMRGIVRWNSEVLDLDPEADRHLGVFIPDPPTSYIDYVRRLA
ncbi:MAG: PilZ domain-containing protein [Acidobacteria bacterium]|nr:PilZ domain-containing protein [Acidobacteriota bacterium]